MNLITEIVSRREVAQIADRIAKNIFAGQHVDVTRQNVALRETIKAMQVKIKILKNSIEELDNNHDRLAGDVGKCAEKIKLRLGQTIYYTYPKQVLRIDFID